MYNVQGNGLGQHETNATSSNVAKILGTFFN
jgi:hypothetical protein